jgi:acetyl esterase
VPLDPQVEALLAQFADAGQPPLNEGTVEAARDTARLLVALDAPPEPVADVHDRDMAGVPVRVYRPAPGLLPVVAWFHAGGGVIGDLDTADSCCRRLANRSGALVVSVDYRRAPEHRFPAAVDDCWAVSAWLGEHAGELGGDPSRLAVGGDSMGGTFAAVVARRAVDAGAPQLRHQLLVYPMTDATLSHPSVDQYADGYILTRDLCDWFYGHYLGDGDRTHPDASPLHADDLRGCAPATILVAELDPVRDEVVAYADGLTAAGVPVTVEHYDGMTHVFFAFGGVLDRATQAMDRASRALAEALA